MPKLGRRMYSQNIVLRGRLASAAWCALLRDCIAAMGMTTAGDPSIWSYPNEDGKGGVGSTICQPMAESFMVVDTWPDHDGAYLHISSCLQFNPANLNKPIREAGLEVEFIGSIEALRIPL